MRQIAGSLAWFVSRPFFWLTDRLNDVHDYYERRWR